MTRRRFLRFAAVMGAAGVGGASVARAAPRTVRLTRHRVPWDGDDAFRVVHLTDLHLGWATPPALVEQALRLCRSAAPDLVVMTGDYLNLTLRYLPDLHRLLAAVPAPCLATLGNHDHRAGAAAIVSAFDEHGIRVLQNASHRLRVGGRGLTVVGIDDGFSRHADVARSLASLSRPEAALVLTHFPETASEVASRGGRLVLSGHTHGGQVTVPVVTKAILRLAGSKYVAGWYSIGSTRLYVNAGVGSAAIRCRLGERAAPEVALIELVPRRRNAR